MKIYTNKAPRKPRTKAERLAVKIAEDVILQLKLGVYEPSHCYFSREATDCRVCAMGAAWASMIKLTTGVSPDFGINSDAMAAQLRPAMNGYAREMEAAYEGWEAQYSDTTYDAAWIRRFRSDKGRMRAIMRNVVRNGGHFRLDEVK